MQNWTSTLFPQNALSWVDPPAIGDLKSLGIYISEPSIEPAIDEYLKIDKSDIENRIACLDQIDEDVLMDATSESSVQLRKIVTSKSSYLKHVLFLYDCGVLYREPNPEIYNRSLLQDFFETSEEIVLGDKTYRSIKMCNDTFYNFEQSRFWGDNWLEIVDPAHRMLDQQKNIWQSLVRNGTNKDDFFTFLETIHIGPKERRKKIFVENELQKKKLIVKDGLINVHSEAAGSYIPLTTPEPYGDYNRQDFIIALDGNIYSSLSSFSTNHASISQGRPVLGGGGIQVQNGLLKELNASSGHYLFGDSDILQTIDIFRQQGTLLLDNLIIEDYASFNNRRRSSLKEFVTRH